MKYLSHVCSLLFLLAAFASASFADHSDNSLRASQAYGSGNFKRAYELWLTEAEKGDFTAQERVAAMSAAGEGTARDDQESFRWYQMAAKQGSLNAQYNLGTMYLKGRGVLQSDEFAYAWWLVAGANGNKTATLKRKALQEKMSATQIEKAQHLAVEILLSLTD